MKTTESLRWTGVQGRCWCYARAGEYAKWQWKTMEEHIIMAGAGFKCELQGEVEGENRNTVLKMLCGCNMIVIPMNRHWHWEWTRRAGGHIQRWICYSATASIRSIWKIWIIFNNSALRIEFIFSALIQLLHSRFNDFGIAQPSSLNPIAARSPACSWGREKITNEPRRQKRKKEKKALQRRPNKAHPQSHFSSKQFLHRDRFFLSVLAFVVISFIFISAFGICWVGSVAVAEPPSTYIFQLNTHVFYTIYIKQIK